MASLVRCLNHSEHLVKRGYDTLEQSKRKLDIMEKTIIKNWYKEKILSDFIDVERNKIKYTEFIKRLKENITNLCDEIQGYNSSDGKVTE